MLDAGVMPTSSATLPTSGQRYELKLHHLHTGEDIDVVYRVGNTYIPSAMEKLNHFLRDHRTLDASHYDPKEFDLLHNLLTRLGRPGGTIDIVCGYRTPWSNHFLRTRSASTGVGQELAARARQGYRHPGAWHRHPQAARHCHEPRRRRCGVLPDQPVCSCGCGPGASLELRRPRRELGGSSTSLEKRRDLWGLAFSFLRSEQCSVPEADCHGGPRTTTDPYG